MKEGDIFLKKHGDRFEFDLNLLVLFRILPLNAILLTNPKEKFSIVLWAKDSEQKIPRRKYRKFYSELMVVRGGGGRRLMKQ